MRRNSLFALFMLSAFAAAFAQEPAPLHIKVTADGLSGPLPCRIHLIGPREAVVQTTEYPSWSGGFSCEGEASLKLPPGEYRYEIEHGPEWSMASGSVTVKPDGSSDLAASLHRLVDLQKEGWWPGEIHVHRPVKDAEVLMKAEDLYVAPFITWWNEKNLWGDKTSAPRPENPLIAVDGGKRFVQLMGGEDERAGGAILIHNLTSPMEITHSTREWPLSMEILKEAKKRGAWIDAEKPFWNDFPAWVASGLVDSVEIAYNHMQRNGMFDGEAWGRARDTQKYPSPQGNALWAQEIYYNLLNCGLRLPPSAGSASGVLANPIGYNRAYVHLDGPLTYKGWWEGLKAGHTFVTNGPLLRVKANGEYPGAVFKAPAGGTAKINLSAMLDSRDPVKAIEIIRNGKIDRSVPVAGLPFADPLGSLEFHESGWFLVRAIADVPGNFRFASTAPFYVEIGETTRISKSGAEFFLQWSKEQKQAIKLTEPSQKAAAEQLWDTTIAFWQAKADESTAP